MTITGNNQSDWSRPSLKLGCAGLRLVSGGAKVMSTAVDMEDSLSTTCLILKSAMEEKSGVVMSVLTNLFKSLCTGERIEFIHHIKRSVSGIGLPCKPYSLSIKVACLANRLVALKKQVAEAILTACPGFHFEPCEDQGVNHPECDALHVLQFALAGAVVAANPSITRFDSQTRKFGSGLDEFLDSKPDARRIIWPFPGKLANWALTAPLYEQMDLPETVEVCIRVHGFSLDDDSCEALHKTMLRVVAGNLNVFHPESPVASYSASAELKVAAVATVHQWLRHPSGYAVDCVVRSSDPLGVVAQNRIAADVFGERPFERVRCFDSTAPQCLAYPTLAWANTPDQGIPALLPGQVRLPSLGIDRHYPVPAITPPQQGSLLGSTVCGQRSSAVALPFASFARHCAIFGSTGAGKSTLMGQMMAADLADPYRSCGVGLIDPHGDLRGRVLSLIPPERAKDVVSIDVSDLTRTACLNPLEGMKENPVHAQFIVGEIMSLVEMLFETKDSTGPMLRNNLRNLLLLSASAPGRDGTFLDAIRILEDSDYRDYLLSKSKDRNLVDFWEKFTKTKGNDNGFSEWIPYLIARLSPFTSNPVMKRLICRPKSSINLAQVMRDKKIVLFNLSKGVLQDIECQILGSLVLMKFFSAALKRASLPMEERPPFHLYIDEFQTFATDSVPRLFSEARKFGLCLITANQSLSQLSNRWGRTNITESILANTATKFMFRLGPGDAEILRPYFRPQFEDGAMATLPDFHAVAAMSDQNRPLPPFVFRAKMAESNPVLHVPASDIVALSDAQYTVPIEKANQELMRLFDLSAESLGAAGQPAVNDCKTLMAGGVILRPGV